jgi:hypothetical protein
VEPRRELSEATARILRVILMLIRFDDFGEAARPIRDDVEIIDDQSVILKCIFI